uniref:60S acidic ribosomal protein P0 n=1 Tax=Pyramimonas obovata TaxID=1411642 RepID=A0A7S0WIR2_9CHLO|mmetsp:Transcript_26725/g.58205  ORF Transcript_26725/g.58205 Transcript_26725/m.58205 type:complete len:314 (+) Transcript_26725:133-1074(+)|eukprot:CAMPEP_0118929686 /NCGR_PEP_ID=MMETSP1169-20130426/6612_1 /TAXON_ID=36882 /ORGANISM="Pyramimonas obovata, Strain CCMP722" /LENGTH=313 /DNA_ID=CAMNT_0006871929 /DNA_START=108 /DNA_END=1049 /DNA_ORIENTATION=-
MPKVVTRQSKKEAYDSKLCNLLETFDKAFLVHADHVGSKQFQGIRAALRPESVILMGKNTMMKRCLRNYIERTGNDKWACLLDVLVGNVGVVFTKADLKQLQEKIGEHRVGAPAKAGVFAPCSVTIPAGSTGMDPSQTSFFQTLNIATKINKGSIEILNDVVVVTKGEKVGPSQAVLLGKLGIRPFTYGLEIHQVIEDGTMFDPAVLSLTDDDLMASFSAGLRNVAALSLGANYPTLASIPHSIINAYKNVLAIALSTEYTFPYAEKAKAYLANPSAFAVAAAPAAGGAAAAAAAPEPEEEEEEEDMGFDLFD